MFHLPAFKRTTKLRKFIRLFVLEQPKKCPQLFQCFVTKRTREKLRECVSEFDQNLSTVV